MSTFLELKNLFKIFGADRKAHPAVDHISLTINEGELVTLLGPSGCGKTTVLRMVAGFENPSGGEILLGGKNITNLPPNKRNVALVFQHYALFPHLSVRDNIAFGLYLRKFPRPKIKQLVGQTLEKTGLADLGQRMPHELSGGQQQRVALARALIIEPKVLLCDEPLSNLDAALRIQMRHEIRRIQREFGITTIYVTHDHEEAMAISDRIILLKDGRIEQDGAPGDFYRQPKTDFVRNFFGNASLIPGSITNAAFCATASLLRFAVSTKEFRSGKASLVLRPESLTIIEG